MCTQRDFVACDEDCENCEHSREYLGYDVVEGL